MCSLVRNLYPYLFRIGFSSLSLFYFLVITPDSFIYSNHFMYSLRTDEPSMPYILPITLLERKAGFFGDSTGFPHLRRIMLSTSNVVKVCYIYFIRKLNWFTWSYLGTSKISSPVKFFNYLRYVVIFSC